MSETLLDSPVVYKMGREFSVSTEHPATLQKKFIMKLEGVHDFV